MIVVVEIVLSRNLSVSLKVMLELVFKNVRAMDFMFRVFTRRKKSCADWVCITYQMLCQIAVIIETRVLGLSRSDKRRSNDCQVVAQNMHQGFQFMLHSSALIDVFRLFVIKNVVLILFADELQVRDAIFQQLLPFYVSVVQLQLCCLCLKHAFSLKSMDFLKSSNKSEKLGLILVNVDISTNFIVQRVSIKQTIIFAGILTLSHTFKIIHSNKWQPQIS